MSTRFRCLYPFVFLTLMSASVSAQTVTVTSGMASDWWDGSLSGLQLLGAGTQLVGEYYNGTVAFSFTPGTRANLNGAISITPNSSNHTFQETVDGTTYPSVWITAQLTFTTQPMLIPSAPEGATTVFSTPFTMAGQFSGYADRELTQQVFSVSVQGSGVASSLVMQMRSGTWVARQSGAQSYGLTGPIPSPWTAADVGAVGTPGISSYGNNVFYVAGAGGDIWGSADAFQFVSQPLFGDGSVVARVHDEQDPDAYAKAGVMIRQTTDAGAADVILDERPGGVIEFMTRPTSGGATTFIASATVGSPPWLQLSRTGSTVTASISTDGTSWTALGTAPLAGNALIGLAVTSHDSTVLNQAFFDNVVVHASSTGGGVLPIGWSHADVGQVGIAGDAAASGGTFTVSGAGADIWGAADAFHYAYTPMNSDGFVQARVVSESNTNAFAKAGVMFRDSLDPGATDVILDVKPDGFVEFMTRAAAGGSTSYITGVQKSFPVSLKIQRNYAAVNPIFIAFVFDAATNAWQQIGQVEIPMGPNATAGLAVTSHNMNMLNTATFDTVEVEKNLIANGSFEGYTPAALTPPWVSDQPLRAVAAVTDTHPHDGDQNGACLQTTYQDCGLYQEVMAPADGSYTLSFFATADHGGALVGVNVAGNGAASADVPVRDAPGNYGATPITLTFTATAGATIRVWMYAPPAPGYVNIDDVSVTQDFTN